MRFLRHLLLALVLAGVAAPSWSAIAIGGSAKGRGDGTTITTAAVTTQATGSTCVIDLIWWEGGAGTFSGVADNKGNTYTLQGSQVSYGSNGGRARRYISVNCAGGTNHTATVTATSSTGMLIFFTEITGGLTTGIVDQSNAREDTASPYTLASALTTTQADELLLSFFAGESASNPATHAETGLGGGSVILTETDGSQYWTGAVAARVVSATGSYNPSWTEVGGTASAVFLTTFKAAAGSPATLSSATPSGTLGTSTTATLGATTDQTSGTFYGVVDTAGNISSITASQVKAGQNNTGASAVAACNASVSTTSPSCGVTGLSAATAYSYAEVQNNGNGDSNVITGTFTTAASASSPVPAIVQQH